MVIHWISIAEPMEFIAFPAAHVRARAAHVLQHVLQHVRSRESIGGGLSRSKPAAAGRKLAVPRYGLHSLGAAVHYEEPFLPRSGP